MTHGGRRSGAGRKPQYSAVPQSPRQLQARWRLTTRWQTLMQELERQGHQAHVHKIPLSILDVPGSKLWLVPWMRAYLACWRKPRRMLEICAGSAIVGLSLLSEGRVASLVLCEKDPDYAAVWHTLFGPRAEYEWLLEQILSCSVLRADLRAWLATAPASTRERALQTVVKSWCYHRGRLSPGYGLLPQTSRSASGASIAHDWKPSLLVQRARSLRDLRRRVTIHEGCGLDYLDAHLDDASTFVYADPPYKSAGKKLYNHYTYDMPRLLKAAAQAKGHVRIETGGADEQSPPAAVVSAADDHGTGR
jgi:DNA adenine methylase